MAFNFTVQNFFQFLEDIPMGNVAAAVESGGLNIPLDIATGEAIVASFLKDFTTGAAPATAAANAAVVAGVPAAAAASGATPTVTAP